LISAHKPFAVGDLEVIPYPVPHDAREPCQFVFGNGDRRVGVLSDAGTITPLIRQQLGGCDALLLECNHDREMLAGGPYRESLKRRGGGNLGHLSNTQAAALLAGVDTGSLQHVVVAHLSEKNNTPERACGALAGALGCNAGWIAVATQVQGLDWREVTGR